MVKNWREAGKRFLRQKAIRYHEVSGKECFFVADFYCPKKRLVIELDGAVHDYQKEHDQSRETILKELGMRIIRFKNHEVFEDIQTVLEKIRLALV